MKKGLFFLVLALFLSTTVMVFASEAPAIHHHGAVNYGEYVEYIQVENVPLGCYVRNFKNGKRASEVIPQMTRVYDDASAIKIDDARTALRLEQGSHAIKTDVVCFRKTILSETWDVFVPQPMEIIGAYNVMPDSTLSIGIRKIVGKYKFVITNNDLLEFGLSGMTIDVYTSAGVSVDNVGVYIDGNSSVKSPLVNSENGVFRIDLTGFVFSSETTSITFVVFGDIKGAEVADTVTTEMAGIVYFNGFEEVNRNCFEYMCAPIRGATLYN